MTVTAIIPIFNQIKYFGRCIDSVLNQTYSDLEIIIVDDGSTDGSGKLCDQYAECDSRIRVIHKKNGGLSSARNAGLDIATGEYITFLDSDDYLALNSIEHFLKLCNVYKAEISIMRMCHVAESTNEVIKENVPEEIQCFTPMLAIEASLYQKLFTCCAPGKLYHKSVLQGIRFPLNKLSEDLAVCHKMLDKATSIVYTNCIGYHYRQQSLSIMHKFNPKRLDAIQWCHEIEVFCNEKYPVISNAATCRAFNVAVHLLFDFPEEELSGALFDQVWNEIKRTRFVVVLSRKVRFREKCAAIVSFMGKNILRKIWESRLAVKQEEK